MSERQTKSISERPGIRDARPGHRPAASAGPAILGPALRAILFGLFATWLGTPASGNADMSQICDRAAAQAAAATGVPISVLKAISLTETGRDRGGTARPWPWTVNMEGKGLWFDSREAALGYAYEHYKRGARSFDVGCFQINYKWHHEHFASIEEMFDPSANALYAANFLMSLFEASGDWETAAGAYHSRTPEHAERYKARFAAYRAGFIREDGLPLRIAAPIVPAADPPGPGGAGPARLRVNSYPLLQAGGTTALGSLVPLGNGAGTSLFARAGAG